MDHGRGFGFVGKTALAIASGPETLETLLATAPPRQAGNYERFGEKAGWVVHDEARASGYLLLSRIDGTNRRPVVELVDLSTYETAHTWSYAPEELLAGAKRDWKNVNYTLWTNERFRTVHPILLEDGGLFVHSHGSPLMGMDRCGQRRSLYENVLYHHSTMTAPDGTIWASARLEPPTLAKAETFRDDAILQMTEAGEVLFLKSVAEILAENGYLHLLFKAYEYSDDPIHLNDVEPVPGDGPFWQAGDVFLSLRNLSMIVLYRPSTNEIIWEKQGPWLAQHDVDVIDESTIGIFNNNVADYGRGQVIDGSSTISFYDFATGDVTEPFGEAMAAADIWAPSNGLFDMTESGHVMVEEDTSGRILIFAPDGTLLSEYINRAADGGVYRLGWSRYIPASTAEAVRASIGSQPPCP